MIPTGFKAGWILVKSSTSSGNWFIYDNVRSDETKPEGIATNLGLLADFD